MSRRTRPASPPRFFWQGVLILLPVVVLAGAGFYSLREDRKIARHEATEKAQALADEMVRVLWAELTDNANLNRFTNHTFHVDGKGRLLFPPPAPGLPVPQRLDLSALEEEQRQAWLAANEPDHGDSGASAIAACRRLLDFNLPTNLAANVTFRLGVLLADAGQTNEAAVAFQTVSERFPEATAESGISLEPLARCRWLELASGSPDIASNVTASALRELCSNLVARPMLLSRPLLEKAVALETALDATNAVQQWRTEWDRQDALRALASSALAQFRHEEVRFTGIQPAADSRAEQPPVPALFWFQAPDLGKSPQRLHIPAIRISHGAGGRSMHRIRNIVASASFATTSGVVRTPELAPAPERPIWPELFPREWLASRLDDGQGGFWIVCRAMDSVTRGEVAFASFNAGCDSLFKKLPPLPVWGDFSLEVAGATVISSNQVAYVMYRSAGKGSGQTLQKTTSLFPPEILASATKAENGRELLRVNIHLISPEELFAAQQARSRLFGLLIAAATLVAVIGFASAWRAFQRQQRLAEMKTNFVSSVSHELRAPIASVRLMAESLERGKVSEPGKQREYFGFIGQECRRLSSLIENVLDFARIEQGRKQYEFEPTDLHRLIEETVKRFEPQADERGIRLVTQLSTLNPQPTVDGRAIQQAFINLLDNAFKHSPNGGEVTVGLEATEDLECGDLSPLSSVGDESPTPMRQVASQQSADKSAHSKGVLRLFVQDHGPGVPPEEHERIFERFYRRGSELRRETQGVGIGLSIVKHIAEAHGGRVTVRSAVGQGSRFAIELPTALATKGTDE